MKFLETNPLCFDDVLLVPQYSEVYSRADIDLSTSIAGIDLTVPIISSNMDSITEADMAIEMMQCGGLGILHRYMDDAKMVAQIKAIHNASSTVPSIGVQAIDKARAECYLDMGIKAICIDVAHGDSKRSIEMISFCRQLGFSVIAGNVCTHEAGQRLYDAGADTIKVGIGPGSLCTTRVVTGHGYPQFSAILECVDPHWRIIADGGIRNSGDICKCLAAGADTVMIGNLFAGCLETPGPIRAGKKIYRGMASMSAQMARDGHVHNNTPEGESMEVPVRGSVKDVIAELVGGIRSGLSYSGATNIEEFYKKAVVVRVSPNCTRENGPHGLK